MDRTNFAAYSSLDPVSLGPDEDQEIARILNVVLKADQDRSSLLDEWRKLTRLRYGIRDPKVFPWKNAANLSVPFIDQAIRKYKPMLMRLLVEPNPIVEFQGNDPEALQVRNDCEILYDWLFKTEMSALEPMAYVMDYMTHRGYGWVQLGWDYQTEYEVRSVNVAQFFPQGPPQDPMQVAQVLAQAYQLDMADKRILKAVAQATQKIMTGSQWVKIAHKVVTADRPAIWDRDPVQVITPPRATDYRNAEWLVVQHVLSLRKLKQMEADGFFMAGTVAKITESLGPRKDEEPQGDGIDAVMSRSLYQEQSVNDDKEKLWGVEDESNVLIWETFHWHDYNGDGLKERVVSFLHPRSKTKLCARPYNFPLPRWPLFKFDFEKTNRRLNSPRGISKLLKDIQREMNHQHNSRLDAMTLRNAPVYQVPAIAGFKARNFRVVPGTVLQLPAGAQITPIMHDHSPYTEQVNEENLLRSIGETYVGIYDSALTSPQSNTNARTATEIQAAMQYTAATATLDATLFQLTMKELHTAIWQLYLDLGPEEVFIRVPSPNASSNDPILKRLTKADIRHKFTLIPVGSVANTNRALQLANAREAMQLFVNDQTGFINPYYLRQWYLYLLDPRWGTKILNPPDQAQELQTLRQAAAASQDPEVQAALNQGQHQIAPEEMPQAPTNQMQQVESVAQ